MTSETDYEGPIDEDLPDEAPEADALEQRRTSTVVDGRPEETDHPDEADPADVAEQRREVPDTDEDDYR